MNGHTAAVFVKFKKNPTKEQLIEKLESYKGVPQELELPSAPKQFIRYMEEDNRPQVTLDVDYENGMGISVGRIREDSVYDWKFVGLLIIPFVVLPVVLYYVQSFSKHRVTLQRSNLRDCVAGK